MNDLLFKQKTYHQLIWDILKHYKKDELHETKQMNTFYICGENKINGDTFIMMNDDFTKESQRWWVDDEWMNL